MRGVSDLCEYINTHNTITSFIIIHFFKEIQCYMMLSPNPHNILNNLACNITMFTKFKRLHHGDI